MDPLNDHRLREALLKRHEERVKRRIERSVEDLLTILDMPSGRRLLKQILDMSSVLSASFVNGNKDLTNFNEGKRDIGIIILSQILKHAPDVFLQMQREAASEIKQDQAEDAKIMEDFNG